MQGEFKEFSQIKLSYRFFCFMTGYSYFRDHYCSGIFFDVWASDYVSAKVKCNNMQGCGCIGILDAREYNGDCETAKG